MEPQNPVPPLIFSGYTPEADNTEEGYRKLSPRGTSASCFFFLVLAYTVGVGC